jgi:hypothetical protein
MEERGMQGMEEMSVDEFARLIVVRDSELAGIVMFSLQPGIVLIPLIVHRG